MRFFYQTEVNVLIKIALLQSLQQLAVKLSARIEPEEDKIYLKKETEQLTEMK